ncbi:MAG TPA: ribonuclease PH [Longimicrobiales bacterium]|nr:ribonuclease PH [Longimicrobiales bacterium]
MSETTAGPAAPARTGRGVDQLRRVTLQRGAAPYAEGSCLISAGRTAVLCTATIEEKLPDWRRGGIAGWVTAEYAMLPRATQTRTGRERGRVGGRTQEIQRLIGRALRASVDLAALGERTILIDCDVLVADGGTRTAAITGAAVALHDACSWLVMSGRCSTHPVRELVAATSVGVIGGEPRLDLEYIEDVIADVDLNLVALESGRLVEVQGTAEHQAFSRAELDRLIDLGTAGTGRLFQLQREALAAPLPAATRE